MFISYRKFAGLQQVLQSYKPHQLRAAIFSHHGKARKTCRRHAIDHEPQRLFRKRHDWCVCYYLRELNIASSAVALVFESIEEIVASHYAQQVLVAINDWIDPLAAGIVIVGQSGLQFRDSALSRKCGNV